MIREIEPKELDQWLQLCKRHAQEAGVDEHDAIDDNVAREQMRNCIISPDYKVFVIDERDELVGYCIAAAQEKLWNKKLYGEIMMFYIDPDIRNAWLAKDLFDYACRWLRSIGAIYVQASCMIYNDDYEPIEEYTRRSRTFFKKQGMAEVGYHFVKTLENA